MTRRFGREVYERIVEPLMAGIYGGNGERLSLDATFPQLRDLERRYGSVIRGLAASREQGVVDAAPPFVSFAGGMGELIEHLEARLREASIQTSVEVVALEPRTGGGFVLVLSDGAGAEADAVILATPAPSTARITRAFDRELSDLHAAIAYGSSVTVSLAFRERDLPRPVAGYGFVVPRVEGSDVVAVTVASNKWPGRATEGHALFRVFLRAHEGGDITCETDDALVDAARRELKETYGVVGAADARARRPLAGGGPAVHARSRRARGAHPRAAGRPPRPLRRGSGIRRRGHSGLHRFRRGGCRRGTRSLWRRRPRGTERKRVSRGLL